jgi:hypothetical protein
MAEFMVDGADAHASADDYPVTRSATSTPTPMVIAAINAIVAGTNMRDTGVWPARTVRRTRL